MGFQALTQAAGRSTAVAVTQQPSPSHKNKGRRKGTTLKTRRIQKLLAAALVSVLAFATTGTYAQEVNTRIGKIETVNGFPTTEGAKKLFDESDFQRASQAYLW